MNSIHFLTLTRDVSARFEVGTKVFWTFIHLFFVYTLVTSIQEQTHARTHIHTIMQMIYLRCVNDMTRMENYYLCWSIEMWCSAEKNLRCLRAQSSSMINRGNSFFIKGENVLGNISCQIASQKKTSRIKSYSFVMVDNLL